MKIIAIKRVFFRDHYFYLLSVVVVPPIGVAEVPSGDVGLYEWVVAE